MRKKWKLLARRLWHEWVRPILTVVIVLTAFRSAVADWNDVPTGSMKPTILEGDRILVNKLAYDLKVPFTTWHLAEWADPERGDIVVCFSPESGTRLVKRVIGLPGDRVAMVNNQLYVNGEPVTYSPLSTDVIGDIPDDQRDDHVFASERIDNRNHAVMATPGIRAKRSFGVIVVSEDEYLVLGDNRDNSRDSRFFDCIPRDQITGQAVGVAFSLNREQWYCPRWNRFFHELP